MKSTPRNFCTCMPPRRTEIQRHAFQRNHPVAQAVQMRIAFAVLAGEVVDQEHGDVARRKELLERQHLTPVAQRILRQQAQLDNESNTTRVGLTRSTSDWISLMVPSSSISHGCRMDCWRPSPRNASADASSKICSASSDQSCEAATSLSSSMVSDKVTYRQLALGRAVEQELQ